MSTQTDSAIEFRCNRCWHPNFASVELSGKNTQCHVCQAEVVVPEVTPERLRPAEVLETVHTVNTVDERLSMSEDQLMRMVQQENHVELGEMQFAGYPDASRIMRLFAKIIDDVVMAIAWVIGVFAVLGAGSAGIIEFNEIADFETIDVPGLIIMAFFPLVASIVQWNLIATRGQSIGKFLTCIRIVSMDGRLPGFIFGVVLRNWLRNLLGMIPFFSLLDALFIFGGSSRCIHDYLAGTRVVQA